MKQLTRLTKSGRDLAPAGLVLLTLFLSVTGPASPEDLLSAARFASLRTCAREAALGGAICSLDVEPTALLTNPAGLSRSTQSLSISADTALMPMGQGLSYVGIAGWAQPEFVLGAGVLTYGAGNDIEFRRGNSDEPDSIASAQSQMYTVGFSSHLLPPIWMGMTFKYMMESIGEFKGAGYSSDIGISYRPYKPIILSTVLRDYFRSAMDWKEPPSQYIDSAMRLGVAWDGGTWRAVADGNPLPGPARVWGFGAEWDAHPRITIRAGLDNLHPTIGFGSRLRYPGKLDSRLDYAFAPAGTSGYMHRFSLVLGLEILKLEKNRMLFPTEINYEQ